MTEHQENYNHGWRRTHARAQEYIAFVEAGGVPGQATLAAMHEPARAPGHGVERTTLLDTHPACGRAALAALIFCTVMPTSALNWLAHPGLISLTLGAVTIALGCRLLYLILKT